MATTRRKPSRVGSQYTASSKSFASSPSMVTSGSLRRSTRPCDHRFFDDEWNQRRFGQHLRREFVRDLVRVDRGFDRERRRQLVAEHREDLADRRALRIGRLHEFGDDELTGLRIARFAGRNQHVALDAAIVGNDVTDAGFDRVATDEAIEATFEHFDDRAFAATAAIHAGDRREHAIAMHHLAHLEGRQEQIVAAHARIGAQEAEAVGVGDHHARDQVHALRRCVANRCGSAATGRRGPSRRGACSVRRSDRVR